MTRVTLPPNRYASDIFSCMCVYVCVYVCVRSYGDVVPATSAGQAMGIFLMISGVCVRVSVFHYLLFTLVMTDSSPLAVRCRCILHGHAPHGRSDELLHCPSGVQRQGDQAGQLSGSSYQCLGVLRAAPIAGVRPTLRGEHAGDLARHEHFRRRAAETVLLPNGYRKRRWAAGSVRGGGE